MEEKKIQCYLKVDEDGNITDAQFGENIIPSNDSDSYFFFWVDDYLEIEEWKIEMNGMKPELVLKSAE